MSPQLIYGTATFGMDMTEFQDEEAVKKMLKTVQSLGIKRLDTAPRYPPLSQGRAEQLLGEAAEVSGDFIIDTKVYTNTATDGSGDLRREAIQKSIHGSLDRLKRPQGVSCHPPSQFFSPLSHLVCHYIVPSNIAHKGEPIVRPSSRSLDTARGTDPEFQ